MWGFPRSNSNSKASAISVEKRAWDLSFGGFSLVAFVREPSLVDLRWGTFTWSCSSRTSNLGSLAKKRFACGLVLTGLRRRTPSVQDG